MTEESNIENKRKISDLSLSEINGTVEVPTGKGFWRI
ncbi:Uncharacterised protein [Aerococcus viridans]|nr:Uncharacterised protein [Aerococcus viridans]SUU06307.1 Uncharacterised protein [Aerococcus viridans]